MMSRMISLVVLIVGLAMMVGLVGRSYGDDGKKWTQDDFLFSIPDGAPNQLTDYACRDKKGDPSCFPVGVCQEINPGFVVPGDPNSVIRVSARACYELIGLLGRSLAG